MKQRIVIPVLNSLRFIFMMVIFFHHMNHAKMFPHGGYIAVSFFFVLSGFAMAIGYRDRIFQPDFSFKSYMIRRLVKFYPLHWLILILFLVFTYNSIVVHQKSYWCEFVADFFLLQSFIPLKDFYFSFNSPSWYLCNTLFYCVLFPYIMKAICQCGRVIKVAIPIFAITAYVLLVIFIPKEWQHAILYINPFVRLLDFLLGVYTGLFFLNRFECQSKVNNDNTWLTVIAFFCITFLGLIAFGFFDNSIYYLCKWFYWIIFCPMIFAISMISIKRTHKDYGGGKNVISKLFQQGGKYSFTFYMIHYICINLLFAPICERFDVSLFLTTTFSFIGTMILTVFCQKFFVEPVGTLLTKNINKYGNNKN